MSYIDRFIVTALLPLFTVAACTNVTEVKEEGPSVKVVIKDGEMMGRLVEEQDSCYLVEVQDVYFVSKAGADVVDWRACDGRGIVFLKEFGERQVHCEADSGSPVCGKIIYQEGYVPDSYPCLGYSNGWFKIDLEGMEAFIEEKYVEWDALDSF